MDQIQEMTWRRKWKKQEARIRELEALVAAGGGEDIQELKNKISGQNMQIGRLKAENARLKKQISEK